MEENLLKSKNKLNVGIGRIFNYYNKSNKKGYFLNDIKSKLKSKNKIIIFNNVNTYRDFIETKDIILALNHMIVKKLKGDYNICSGKKIYLKKIILYVNRKINKKILFLHNKQLDLIGDNSKLKKTGWSTKYEIKYSNFV